MLEADVRAVTVGDLAKYDFLLHKITELEAEKVECRLRPEESKLRGLQQMLATYEETLGELWTISQKQQHANLKAAHSFDLLGKKHKCQKLMVTEEKWRTAVRAYEKQVSKIEALKQEVDAQIHTTRDLRWKVRELDAARQAESDLVDRLFQNDHLILDTQHDALEDAVCGVAPRIFRLREASAASADVHQKLQNAAQQMRRATHELEQAFEPAHRALTNEFGEQEGEVFYDPADAATKLQAAGTANKLIKSGVHNMAKARQRMDAVPQLPTWNCSEWGLATILDPVMQRRMDATSLEARRFMRDCINTLYVSESQIEYAAREAADYACALQGELHRLESILTKSKSKLDTYRRDLLSQVQEAKRSNSLRLSEDDSLSVLSGTEFDKRLKKRFGSSDSLSSMGEKVPSINSGMSRLAGWH